MRFIKVLIIILFVFVGLMILIQNNEVLSTTMSLRFDVYVLDAWKSIPLPFYFLLLVSFLIGALFTLSYFLVEKIRMSAELRSCRSRLGRLEKELNSLRNLPLEGAGLESAAKDKGKAKKDKSKKAVEPAPAPVPAEPVAEAAPAAAAEDKPEPSPFSADFLTSGPGSFGGSDPDDQDKS